MLVSPAAPFVDQTCDADQAKEGARWLQKAADLGHKRAQRDLGFLFTDGRPTLGIERNCKRGVFYLATAGLFGMVREVSYTFLRLQKHAFSATRSVQDFVF